MNNKTDSRLRARRRTGTRSPYRVIPKPHDKTLRVHPNEVFDAYRYGGLSALRDEVRTLLRLRIRGRAQSPQEVALMLEWLDDETRQQVESLLDKLTGANRPEVEPKPEPVAVENVATCSQCARIFTRDPAATGRPRARCYDCSPPR